MAITDVQKNSLDKGWCPEAQKVQLGTLIQTAQTAVAALEAAVTAIEAGKGITLPTSDPAVAGELWADTLTVKVSAGE